MNIGAIARRRVSCLLLAAAGLATALPAVAAPMEYKGTWVTDIKVGNAVYTNAAVTISFVGDTKEIVQVPQPAGGFQCAADRYYWLPNGLRATLTVESKGRTIVAHLDPTQLFVGLDVCNGGIGIGSYTGPKGLEPAYPLGFHHGTATTVAYDSLIRVPCCTGTPDALKTPANMSGDAWSCVGYPPDSYASSIGNGTCGDPGLYPALKSDRGDVFIYEVYEVDNNNGTIYSGFSGVLNRGTFSILPVLDD